MEEKRRFNLSLSLLFGRPVPWPTPEAVPGLEVALLFRHVALHQLHLGRIPSRHLVGQGVIVAARVFTPMRRKQLGSEGGSFNQTTSLLT